MRRQTLHQQLPLVALLLLAVYGCAGVLGYGLHSLWGCGHCHEGVCQHDSFPQYPGSISHEGLDLQLCGSVSGGLVEFQGREITEQGNLVLAQGDCPICAFLVQAQSQFVLNLDCESVEPVPTIPPAIAASYVSPLLGSHPGRGPPAC